MTVSLSGNKVARQITDKLPGAVCEASSEAVLVKGESIFNVIEYLKSNPDLDFHYLNYITAVDYLDYFEVVY